ncbi:autotransporter outer membrane beta-barrel domain-containing protein [Sphingomonas beigongshangi]|uniref:autotransporter outer membrane beta-barrel domain-containing protein n=1 Tax=Sphingomonas beigongshangi TaxID=2782540 RepID=UPI00193B8A3D|nr:autotransporter outer membrane beta-barrel domain-containing protein [Sphingomonas beigongshangi]
MRRLLVTSAAAVSTCALTGPAFGQAAYESWWYKDGTLYQTGQETGWEGDFLELFFAEAAKRGITINRVVLRDNPGGFAVGGLQMADFFFKHNTTVVIDGGCYSACGFALIGSPTRGIADASQRPTIYDGFGPATIIGFHGGSAAGQVLSSEWQDALLDYLSEPLARLPQSLRDRIVYAVHHMKDSQAFLRYQDPAGNLEGNPVTSYCDTGAGWHSGTLSGCITYNGVDMRNDGLINMPGYQTMDDILKVTTKVKGDLNPYFNAGTMDDFFKGQYGQITIDTGGQWDLDTRSGAWTVWVKRGVLNIQKGGYLHNGQIVADRGTINLDGGTITTNNEEKLYANFDPGLLGPLFVLKNLATLSGSGRIAGYSILAGTILPTALEFHLPSSDVESPIQADISGLPRYRTELRPTSQTIFQVAPTTTKAALTNYQERVWLNFEARLKDGGDPTNLGDYINVLRSYNVVAPIGIFDGATVGANFARGFYRPGQVIPLMQGVVDSRDKPMPQVCIDAVKVGYPPCLMEGAGTTIPSYGLPYVIPSFFFGRFGNFLRDGEKVALDPTKLSQVVTAKKGSMLGFDLVYTPMDAVKGFTPSLQYVDIDDGFSSLSLVARPAFEDTSVFANAASGDGLGKALRTASYLSTPGNAELLGALQFSTFDQARAASGDLRGDGHATQVLADRAILDSVAQVQDSRIADLRGGRFDTPTVAGEVSATALSRIPGTTDAAIGALVDAIPDTPAALAGAGDVNLAQAVDTAPAQTAPTQTADSASDTASAPTDAAAGEATASGARTGRSWARVLAGRTKVGAGGGVRALRSDYVGVVMGYDVTPNDGDVSLGGSLSYVTADSAAGGYAYRDHLKGYGASVFGVVRHKLGSVALQGSVTRIDHASNRLVSGIDGIAGVNRGTLSRTAVSAQLDNVLSAKGKKGLTIDAYIPVVTYRSLSGGSTVESGSPAALAVAGTTFQSVQVGAGGGIAYRMPLKGQGSITPFARVSYSHELGDTNAALSGAFATQADVPFAIRSQTLGRDAARIAAGVTTAASDQLKITLTYQGAFRDNLRDHAGLIGIAARF